MMREVSLSNPYIQVLSKSLGNPKIAPNNQVRFNSPFTPVGKKKDIKRHLYVSVEKKKFFCFRTSTGGSLSYLFAILGEEYTDDPDLPVENISELRHRANRLLMERKFIPPRVGLPEEYRSIRIGSVVHSYLLNRGITNDDILYYKIGEGCDEYSGWAIIPSFDQNNNCEYWVARSTDKDSWGRRYDNPQSSKKYHVPFLQSSLRESGDNSFILCEGVFSAIAAGRTAAASLGKFVSDTQISVIQSSGAKLVRLCLDGDAWKETLDVADRLLARGLYTTIIPMPIKEDPSDMGRVRFYEHVRQYERFVTREELLRMKLEAI